MLAGLAVDGDDERKMVKTLLSVPAGWTLEKGKPMSPWGAWPKDGPKLGDSMAAFNLDRIADVPVRMLSTGQARRARLARVMASGKPLWLLDEPLNGLDVAGSDQLAKVIAGHRKSGGAVVTASHSPLAGDWQMLELGG